MMMSSTTGDAAFPSVAMTGAGGFLGWHTRAALRETDTKVIPVPVGERFDIDQAAGAVEGRSRLIHIAGVNRAPEEEVIGGNVAFAEQVASALLQSDAPPSVVVYANSTQAGNKSAYGQGKARAAEILAEAADGVGSEFVDLKLPNLFGEHGKPYYNAVTATFCHLVSEGVEPTIERDQELTLLHVQNAADLLSGAVDATRQRVLEEHETVSGLLERIRAYADRYRLGEIPDIASAFDRDLFNTYRSYTVDKQVPIALTRHADARGSFFEVIRSHGGAGQTSFSTTAPTISRGNHFHRRKVERFTVLSGRARITLRKLFSEKTVHLDVNGEQPVAVDMPTMWAHSITNTGDQDLFTAFWTNDLFDPSKPDTISEVA